MSTLRSLPDCRPRLLWAPRNQQPAQGDEHRAGQQEAKVPRQLVGSGVDVMNAEDLMVD
jgi:hypothetical protein